jgi:hypothetical protein
VGFRRIETASRFSLCSSAFESRPPATGRVIHPWLTSRGRAAGSLAPPASRILPHGGDEEVDYLRYYLCTLMMAAGVAGVVLGGAWVAGRLDLPGAGGA